MPGPAHLASVWRGDVLEEVVRGHVAVVDAGGAVLAAVGDPAAVTTLRSCVKPIQALPFVRQAAPALSVDAAAIAIACASHNGEEAHVAAARGLLAAAGLDEATLECGPQLPSDAASARRLLAAGEEPRPIHNNCSGKHAAMLATCVVAGWPVAGYSRPDHPCQQTVTGALAEVFRLELASVPRGIDGCGLPTYGVPLATLARGFAAGSRHEGFVTCQDAMAGHPHLVAGTGRFDTALLAHAGATLTAKIGGAAVWAAVRRPDGPAVALKLEAGGGDAVPPVALAVLQRLGWLAETLPDPLPSFAAPRLRNWAGTMVGETRVEPAALQGLAAAL